VTRPAITTQIIQVSGQLTSVYLPIIVKSGTGATSLPPSTEAPAPEAGGELLTLSLDSGVPAQVAELTGSADLTAGATRLEWTPNNGILGYRIYRASAAELSFRRLADVPADAATFTDDTATCGKVYLVTAYNDQGESLPSTASYFNPPCQ
jgi:hypothetical protein